MGFERYATGVVDVPARVYRGEMEDAPDHACLDEPMLAGEDALDEGSDIRADDIGFF
jgi:hypothetical protein